MRCERIPGAPAIGNCGGPNRELNPPNREFDGNWPPDETAPRFARHARCRVISIAFAPAADGAQPILSRQRAFLAPRGLTFYAANLANLRVRRRARAELDRIGAVSLRRAPRPTKEFSIAGVVGGPRLLRGACPRAGQWPDPWARNDHPKMGIRSDRNRRERLKRASSAGLAPALIFSRRTGKMRPAGPAL